MGGNNARTLTMEANPDSEPDDLIAKERYAVFLERAQLKERYLVRLG